MNKCAICEKIFKKWHEYYQHTQIKCVKKFVAVNTSGRSKRQIVEDAENSWLKPYLTKQEEVIA